MDGFGTVGTEFRVIPHNRTGQGGFPWLIPTEFLRGFYVPNLACPWHTYSVRLSYSGTASIKAQPITPTVRPERNRALSIIRIFSLPIP
jgi:hypothetical protein